MIMSKILDLIIPDFVNLNIEKLANKAMLEEEKK
jgi:hypothetical protein